MINKIFVALVAIFMTIAMTLPSNAQVEPQSRDNVEGTYGAISAFFTSPNWEQSASTSDPNASGDKKWSYANYPMNCLPGSTTGTAIKFLSVRSTWSGENYTGAGAPIQERQPNNFRATVRKAISLYAASIPNMVLNSTTKPKDRTPRIITFQDSSGNCQPLVETVHVPREILQREPYQAWDHDGNSATPKQLGLWPYLESVGYNQANRRYITMVETTDPTSFYLSDYYPGGMGAAIALARWSTTGFSDTSPGGNNRCQSGGAPLMDVSMNDGAYQDNGGGSTTIAHELMHTLCGPILSAPNWATYGGGHVNDCYDMMGYCSIQRGWEGNEDGTAQCGSAAWPNVNNDNKGNFRFDCAGDDYWGPLSYNTHRTWNTTRYSAFDNRFLWGAQNVSNANFDFAPLGISPQCTYDPNGYCPPGVTPAGG